MAVFFSGSEILLVAINIEENGIVFYETLMLNTKRPVLKAAYDYLAGQEKVHKKVFSKMLETAGKSWAVESYPGEQAAYLKALADSVMFTPGKAKDMADKVKTDEEALDIALGFEKDAVLFYTEMRGIVREQDIKTVEWVTDQEKSHIKRILDLKSALAGGQLQEYGH